MTALIENLALGFGVSITPFNLAFCFLGTLLGTLIGVLPGIGPVATIAMLLPVTFGLPPTTAIIMLAGIFYGAQYGGSTTAILINIPGESSSVVTALDGYSMARAGRAGAALAIAALGSFFAGCVATAFVAAIGPLLSKVALSFAPADYFSLMVMGLFASIVLASGSVLKAVAMIVAGLALGLVGADIETGVPRFTFGQLELYDGINFVPVAMGLFGVAEVLRNLETSRNRTPSDGELSKNSLTGDDLRMAWPAVLRGRGGGTFLGVLPGGGATLSSFAAYALEKKLSRDPTRFGRGAIEGVASPEAANNAAAQTSFIPLLTLGLPTNAVMALLVGAFTLQGIQPGPLIMAKQPELFWGLIVSMWIGNLFLVILNLPLIGLWVRLLRIPYGYLYPAILLLCAIGAYSLSNSTFDVLLTAMFGLLGYGFLKLGLEPAPFLLGFVLGPMMEENFRRSLNMSHGDVMVFVERPISLTFLILTVAMMIPAVLPAIRRRREQVFQEND